MRVNIDFNDAVFGCSKDINLDVVEECDDCEGAGGYDSETCSRCYGSGTITSEQHTILGSFVSRTKVVLEVIPSKSATATFFR